MDRAAVDRKLEESPIYDSLSTAWETMRIGGKVFRITVLPPYDWFKDAIYEANVNFTRCAVPLTISMSIWLIGFGVLNFGEVATLIGASDRQEVGVYIGFTREVCTWITMMILAGVAGSALAADLGARKIRDELDALAVLGVDHVRKLIVPRVVAMAFCAIILALLALLVSMLVNGALYPDQSEYPVSVYTESIKLNVLSLDLYGSMLKHLIMGAFIGLIACQKGLATKGGAEGVGRTVNQTVIVAFFGIWLINSLYNLGFLTLFPELSVPKG